MGRHGRDYGAGRSEGLVGRAIEGRQDVMVFTKVGSAPRGSGFRPEQIRAALRHLDREVIDLCQIHWPDEAEVPLEDRWGAMGELVDAGLVRWIGISNFNADQLECCERVRHVDALQPQLSMLWHDRMPLLPICERNGTGVVAFGPSASGLLTGAITRDTVSPMTTGGVEGTGVRAFEQLFARGRFVANLKVVAWLKLVARRLDIPLAQLALAWVLHQCAATGAMAGSRTPQHVRENAGAFSVKLSPKNLVDIEVVLQRRGGVVI